MKELRLVSRVDSPQLPPVDPAIAPSRRRRSTPPSPEPPPKGARPPGLGRRLLWRGYRAVLFRLFDIEIRGALPQGTGAVLACNHPSMADGPVATLLDPRIRSVATRQRNPLFQLVMERWGTYFVGREGLIERASADLRAGNLVWIAPEGTRSDYQIERVKSGAVVMAQAAGVPVVPMVVTGTQEAWASLSKLRTWLPWSRDQHRIVIELGEPFWPEGDAKTESQRLRGGIRALQAKHGIPAAPRGLRAGANAASGRATPLQDGMNSALARH